MYFSEMRVLLIAACCFFAVAGDAQTPPPNPLNMALAVLAGDADAGAVKREVFEETAAQGLKALATTPSSADHFFVTRSTFPVAGAARLREMLLSLHLTTDGKLVLANLQNSLTALLSVAESDCANLRSILRDLKLEED